MPDIQIQCPHCGTTLVGDTDEAGALYPCPNCGKEVQIPAARPSAKAPTPKIKIASSTRQCPYCGEVIQRSAIKCKFCGEFLTGRDRLPSSSLPHMSSFQSTPQKVPKPACVSIAVFLLFAQMIVGWLVATLNPAYRANLTAMGVDPGFAVGVSGFVTFILCLIILGINAGHGWCRMLFLILTGISLPFYVIGLFMCLSRGIPIPVLELATMIVSTIEFCLLASSSAGKWYRAKAEGRGA